MRYELTKDLETVNAISLPPAEAPCLRPPAAMRQPLLPAGTAVKVSSALGKSGASGTLVNLEAQVNGGNFQPAQVSALKIYEVTTVSKVSETDRSGLEETGESCLTLYTCVRDQRDLRRPSVTLVKVDASVAVGLVVVVRLEEPG